jgi:hypothetical protein
VPRPLHLIGPHHHSRHNLHKANQSCWGLPYLQGKQAHAYAIELRYLKYTLILSCVYTDRSLPNAAGGSQSLTWSETIYCCESGIAHLKRMRWVLFRRFWAGNGCSASPTNVVGFSSGAASSIHHPAPLSGTPRRNHSERLPPHSEIQQYAPPPYIVRDEQLSISCS